jgi:ABC-type uncharacterized transport system auxiliary subunit
VAGPAPRDHFYHLEATPPEAARPAFALHGTVEVARPSADALTRERAILYRPDTDSAEVTRHAYHHWTDSPTLLVQQQLATYLRRAGAAPSVVTPDMRVASDFLVGGRLVRLEHARSASPPRVVIELELTVMREDGHELLLQRSYREEEAVSGEGMDAVVRAFQSALTTIFERFVADAAGAAS